MNDSKYLENYFDEKGGRTFTQEEAKEMFVILIEIYITIHDRNHDIPTSNWSVNDFSVARGIENKVLKKLEII